MIVYYVKIKIRPNIENKSYNVMKGAIAHCWILEEMPDTAFRKAIFYIKKDNWEIDEVESYPVEVKRTDFLTKEFGLTNYDKAIEKGMAFVYVGWARNGKSSFGPTELTSSFSFDLEQYLKLIKKNKNRGRCLHFEAGNRCNNFIKAHSIQNKQLLTLIQKNGKVYRPVFDIGTLKKNFGKLSYKKDGIKMVSTFMGFCQKHDNEIFKAIDTSPLKPTDQQIFLYAYRSLCRELFAKENAVNTIKSQLEKGISQETVKNLLSDMELGFSNGLRNLKSHKMIYDEILKNNHYHKIRYTLFTSTKKPNIVFSGGIFPDFDFIGRKLQDLSNIEKDLSLVTFCSAPMESGWGFLFAWHEKSLTIAVEYIRSLATAFYKNGAIEDYLFRLTMNCENHAISPLWWESKSETDKNKVEEYITKGVNLFAETPHNYLMSGLEDISGWKFDGVISNY